MNALRIVLLLAVMPALLPARASAGGGGQAPRESALAVSALKEMGEQMIAERKLQDAITVFREVVHRAPRDLGAQIRLADCWSWTGDYDHAIALYRDIVAVDSLNLGALKGLARVMRWSTRYREAEAIYASILRIEPDDLDALGGLAER